MTTQETSVLFDTILETIAALVVVMDSDGRVLLLNEACEDLTGYTFEELEGRPMWDLLIPADERPGVMEVFDELSAGNFPNRYENDWLTQDGQRRTIDWSNSAIIDEQGEVELVVSTGVDITERREAEKAKRELIRSHAAREAAEAVRDSLRLSEGVFSGIVDLCADAIISVNAAQKITLFNQGAEEIFGYTPDEVLGQPLEILLPSEARAAHAAHIQGFSNAEKPSRRMGDRGAIYGLRKNGELFPAEASISKQKIDGEWVFTAIVRDVTEEQAAQHRLKQANEELERSNADLEHFAAVASHDLQEPLRKIQAFGERLQSRFGKSLPERGQDYIDRMQNAAGRMSTLIDDLLAFSRVTTRARPFENLNLSDLIDDVVCDLEMRIEQSQGRVDIGPLPAIDADPIQMRLLFQNLIANGLKFHRQGVPPIVEVGMIENSNEIEPSDKPEGDPEVCRIFVKDNGTGFDEKYLDRIFDVFQRLHGRGVYEGTGMGLAIARKIVERHGGGITATSTPGEGARFIITLPIEQSESNKEANDEQ